MGVVLVDVNNDGKPDIYAANDSDPNYFYLNQSKRGEIRLEEKAVLAGCALDGRGRATGSMGVDAADFNRTGRASILVTTYENELPSLHRNDCIDGRINFSYATSSTGMGAIGGNYVTGSGDLSTSSTAVGKTCSSSTANAIRYPDAKPRTTAEARLIEEHEKGRFKAITPSGGDYFRNLHNARGVAFGDIRQRWKVVDMVISHLNEPVVVLRNVATNENHWIGIGTRGREGSRLCSSARGAGRERFQSDSFCEKDSGSFASASDRPICLRTWLGIKCSGRSKYTGPSPEKVQGRIDGLEPDSYYRIREGNANVEKIR